MNIHSTSDFDSFVAFDIETTGFSSSYDGITQIGAVRVRNGIFSGRSEDMFDMLVFQGNGYGRRIPRNIEGLTGITNSMVANAAEIDTVLREFIGFIGNDVLVGYNCFRFDCRFLDAAQRYCGLRITNEYYDVCSEAKSYIRQCSPRERKYNLGLICDLIGVTNRAAHNAYSDAETTAQVYLRLRESRASRPGREASSLRPFEPDRPPVTEVSYRNVSNDPRSRPVRGSLNQKNASEYIDVPPRASCDLIGRDSDDLDAMIAQLWANYPDGVLPATYLQLSRETGILIYELRTKVKAAHSMTLETYLSECGFVQIPKKGIR